LLQLLSDARIAATKRLFPAGDRTQPKERGGEKEGIREWHLFDPFGSPAEYAKGSERTALLPSLPSSLPFPFLFLSFASLGNRVQVISFFPSFALLALPTKSKDMVFRFIIEYSSLRDFGP
jgi:hypothetical protein